MKILAETFSGGTRLAEGRLSFLGEFFWDSVDWGRYCCSKAVFLFH